MTEYMKEEKQLPEKKMEKWKKIVQLFESCAFVQHNLRQVDALKQRFKCKRVKW